MGDYVYLLFGLLVIVPLLALWIWIIFDAIARPDLKLGAKALWAAGVLIFPLVGGIAYLYFRAKAKPVVQDVEGYYEPLHTSRTDAPGPPLY